ncbi:MAG TPA: NAD-dependent epimerase/dehydratase family protein [Pseudobdellovibrionaceae bacterium]|nr:NAD-dependent epimerase/dehydratase family protein [Pseudobdellovibrionaceae bacterium]
MKILVTGGAGYIGSILVPKLLGLGHEVTVVDNFMYNQTPLLDVTFDDKLTLIRGDVRDHQIMKPLMAKADAVLPLACLTGAPLCKQDPIGARTINHDAVKMLFEMKSKDQMMVFPCTNSGYGVGEAGIHCDENSAMRPVSLYGQLKVEIEKVLLDSGHVATFRLATVMGTSPRMRLDLLVNDFTYRAVNDRFIVLFEAHFKRNYLHVRDAADAFIHTLNNYDKMKGQPYNVGLSEANLSKMELCLAIKKQIPEFTIMESEIGEDPDKRNYIISNAKIEATGFKAKVGLDQSLRELIRGFKIIKRNSFANI